MPEDTSRVKQIGQYPLATSIGLEDLLLLQVGGPGGPYNSLKTQTVLGAFEMGGFLRLAPYPEGGIAFNGATITFANGAFSFSENIIAANIEAEGGLFQNGEKVATELWTATLFDVITENTVWSFNGRKGDVLLTTDDVRRAGAVPNVNPAFFGQVTAPTIWNPTDASELVATTSFVQSAIHAQAQAGCIVGSFNGRGGDVWLTADDITYALTQPGAYALVNTPPIGDASKRIANTLFVDESMIGLQAKIESDLGDIANKLDQQYAPLDSPQFTGIPTAPTATPGSSTGQLATTAFVQAAVTASTTGVSSFNTRTGAVVLTTGDVTSAGGAPLASPAFTGNPTATTQAPGNSSTRLATTAFVGAAIAAVAAGVTSWNTRTGAVVLTAADVTGVGGALLASPALSGTPTAPTALPATNNTQIATTAYVTTAIAALPSPVSSFNGRTGAVTFQASDISAVGGALLASPNFTGTPTAPTPAPGTSNTDIATTAFVQAAVAAGTAGVTSFNTRTGAVVLTTADVTGAGGAVLASPAFTGTPTAPTATAGTNSGQLATTAFVTAAIAASPGGVTSFNSRTGAITLLGSDVSAAGGALIASPTFTGTPAAPTATPGTSTTQLATTAFVANALSTAGGVSSFNGRAGAVTLTLSDILGASGQQVTAVAATAPTSPAPTSGNLWFNTTTNQMEVYATGSWQVPNAPAAPTFAVQTFTASGTYTTPANSTTATIYRVRMVAGGGGGGGSGTGATVSAGGAGGGEGKEFIITSQPPNTAWTITIGAAGAGGSNTTSTPGGTGGNTSIAIGGQTIVCNGGVGGGFASVGGNPPGGAGGAGGATPAITGLTLLRDVAGQSGSMGSQNVWSFGGASLLGLGGTVANATVNNLAAPTGYGSGGAGGWAIMASGTYTTATGAPGVVFIERIAG